jgi:hypothetical protein
VPYYGILIIITIKRAASLLPCYKSVIIVLVHIYAAVVCLVILVILIVRTAVTHIASYINDGKGEDP